MNQFRFLADHDLNEHIVVGVRGREPTIELLHVRDLGMNDKSTLRARSAARLAAQRDDFAGVENRGRFSSPEVLFFYKA